MTFRRKHIGWGKEFLVITSKGRSIKENSEQTGHFINTNKVLLQNTLLREQTDSYRLGENMCESPISQRTCIPNI